MSITETAIANNVLISEAYFQKLLIDHREKAHELKKPFMLTVVDADSLLNDGVDERETHLHNLSRSIHESTRDVDVKGWYSHNSLIGIIRPSLIRADRNWVTNRLTSGLHSFLGEQETANIKIYHMFFPDNNDEHNAYSGEGELDFFDAKRREFFYS